jgi:hypothetical protein
VCVSELHTFNVQDVRPFIERFNILMRSDATAAEKDALTGIFDREEADAKLAKEQLIAQQKRK